MAASELPAKALYRGLTDASAEEHRFKLTAVGIMPMDFFDSFERIDCCEKPEKGPPIEPVMSPAVVETQRVVTATIERLEKELERIAKLDSLEKRAEAHRALVASLSAELQSKQLSFSFIVGEVDTHPVTLGPNSELDLETPSAEQFLYLEFGKRSGGTRGLECVRDGVSFKLSLAESKRIHVGDTVVLRGKGCLIVPTSLAEDKRRAAQPPEGYTTIGIWKPAKPLFPNRYVIGLTDATVGYTVDKQK